jgi:hypothetical protein
MISSERILIGFRRIPVVAESAFFFFRPVILLACISAVLTRRISVVYDIGDLPCYSVETIQI